MDRPPPPHAAREKRPASRARTNARTAPPAKWTGRPYWVGWDVGCARQPKSPSGIKTPRRAAVQRRDSPAAPKKQPRGLVAANPEQASTRRRRRGGLDSGVGHVGRCCVGRHLSRRRAGEWINDASSRKVGWGRAAKQRQQSSHGLRLVVCPALAPGRRHVGKSRALTGAARRSNGWQRLVDRGLGHYKLPSTAAVFNSSSDTHERRRRAAALSRSRSAPICARRWR